MLRNPNITSVSTSSAVPFDVANNFQMLNREGEEAVPTNIRFIDENYLETYKIKLVTGRNFSPDYATDVIRPLIENGEDGQNRSAAIFNEAAVRKFGFSSPQEAIGSILEWAPNGRELEVVGVIPDIHIMPADYDDEAMFYAWSENMVSSLNIRFEGGDVQGITDFIDNTWATVTSNVPITRVFLSERIETQYGDIEARATMLGVFSLLAVFVSSLGLYGLASFTAQTRTQEVGIRKVLGANVGSIVKLLGWQFSKPVIVANLIAWPVAWYLMSDWLDGFVYRIDLNIIYFIVAGLLTLGIAWATVGAHAYRVARTNPIHALRYE